MSSIETASRKLRSSNRMPWLQRKSGSNPAQATESMVSAINTSSALAAPAFITWTIFATFAAITAASTTDLQLLLDSPIAVPLLPDAKLPHSYYYASVGWFLLALHLHLLIHVDNISRKVRHLSDLTRRCSGLDRTTEITSLPIVNWLANRQNGRWSINFVQAIVAWISIVAAPLAVQLLHQAAFLPYQSEAITWSQRLVLLIHGCAIVYFWHRITNRIPHGKAAFAGRLRSALPRLILVWLPVAIAGVLSMVFMTIPDEKLEFVLESAGLKRMNSAELAKVFGEPASFQFQEREEKPQFCGYSSTFGKIPIAEVAVPIGLRTNCITAGLFHGKGPFHRTIRIIGRPENTAEKRDSMAKFDTVKLGGPLLGFGRSFRYAHMPALDLHDADLRVADISYANLERADLKNAQMHGAKATNTQIDQADLRGALLYGADLSSANLSGSDLRGAKLGFGHMFSNAEPFEAWVGGKLFRGAILNRSIFAGADLRGLNLSFLKCTGCWFEAANLTGVVAIHSDFTDAKFMSAKMDGAVLVAAQFTGGSLYSASMIGANLDGATFEYAHLEGANLSGASLQNANFQLADLTSAILHNANFSPSLEKDAMFASSSIHGAKLLGADLRGANLTDVDLSLARSDAATKSGSVKPDYSKYTRDWSRQNLPMQDAAARLSRISNQGTSGLKPTSCFGPLKGCPKDSARQAEVALNYAAFIRKAICDSKDERLRIFAANRLVDDLFGGEASTLAPIESKYPLTSSGADWPGFKTAIAQEGENVVASKCIGSISEPLENRIKAGLVFLKSAGQTKLPEPGYRLTNAQYAYPIELSQRYYSSK